MGRWRPPPERSTALITREGQLRLQAELDTLWRVRRPEVVRALYTLSLRRSSDLDRKSVV